VHSANFWARYNVAQGALKGLGLGTGIVYQSERLGVTTNDPALQFKMSGYYKADTALYYNWRNYSFSLNVKNIFDKRYLPGGGTGTTAGNVRIQPGEPRQVVASVRLTF
jgi:iron complex outermembrane receptor protein